MPYPATHRTSPNPCALRELSSTTWVVTDQVYQYPDSILASLPSLRFDCSASSPKQHISVRSMLAGPFTVFSPDPAYSDLVVEQIKERLTYLKLVISGSAQPRQRQTYEL